MRRSTSTPPWPRQTMLDVDPGARRRRRASLDAGRGARAHLRRPRRAPRAGLGPGQARARDLREDGRAQPRRARCSSCDYPREVSPLARDAPRRPVCSSSGSRPSCSAASWRTRSASSTTPSTSARASRRRPRCAAPGDDEANGRRRGLRARARVRAAARAAASASASTGSSCCSPACPRSARSSSSRSCAPNRRARGASEG